METTDLRRATALPGFIGHSEENRLSCGHRCAGVCARGICHACPASEKGPIRSSLCVPMMPSLQRGPAKSILTPSQIDGPSSRVCLGHAALTYVPTPHDSPIHISLLFFHLSRLPSSFSLFTKCYIRKNMKILLANSIVQITFLKLEIRSTSQIFLHRLRKLGA